MTFSSGCCAWAEANPDAPWVLGRGWFSHSFPGNQPTRQQLDAVIKRRPAQILSHDGRTSWVNTRALRLAGITRKTADPPHGVIVKDPRTGEPTGVLTEAAVSLVSQKLPQPTREERVQALRAAIDEAHRNGVTSIQNAGGSTDEFELYADALRSGDLSLRVYSALSVDGVTARAGDRGSSTRSQSVSPTIHCSRLAPSRSCSMARSTRTRRPCSSLTPTLRRASEPPIPGMRPKARP